MAGWRFCILVLMCLGFLVNYGFCMEDLGTDMDDFSLPSFQFEPEPKDNQEKFMNGKNNGEGNSMPDAGSNSHGLRRLMKMMADAKVRKEEQVKVIAKPLREKAINIPPTTQESTEEVEEDPADVKSQADEVPVKANSEPESVEHVQESVEMPESDEPVEESPDESADAEAPAQTEQLEPEPVVDTTKSDEVAEPVERSTDQSDDAETQAQTADSGESALDAEVDVREPTADKKGGDESEDTEASDSETELMNNGQDNVGTGKYGLRNGEGNVMLPMDMMEEFMANVIKGADVDEDKMREISRGSDRIGSADDFRKNLDAELDIDFDDMGPKDDFLADMGPKDDFLADMDSEFDTGMDLDLDLDLDFKWDF